MPIEIKELHVKVSVTSPETNKPGKSGTSEPSPCADNMEREQIVADCVEQVLQILKAKGER